MISPGDNEVSWKLAAFNTAATLPCMAGGSGEPSCVTTTGMTTVDAADEVTEIVPLNGRGNPAGFEANPGDVQRRQ